MGLVQDRKVAEHAPTLLPLETKQFIYISVNIRQENFSLLIPTAQEQSNNDRLSKKRHYKEKKKDLT